MAHITPEEPPSASAGFGEPFVPPPPPTPPFANVPPAAPEGPGSPGYPAPPVPPGSAVPPAAPAWPGYPAAPGSSVPATHPSQPHGSRIGLGIAIGVAVGVLFTAVLFSIGAFAWYVSGAPTLLGGPSSDSASSPPTVNTVPTTTPWLVFDNNGNTTVKGWPNGNGSSGGTDGSSDSIGTIGLMVPTRESGISAWLNVEVQITDATKMTLDGKPWKPTNQAGKTPAQYFVDLQDSENNQFDSTQMIVKAHDDGGSLTADSIDLDTQGPQTPDWMY